MSKSIHQFLRHPFFLNHRVEAEPVGRIKRSSEYCATQLLMFYRPAIIAADLTRLSIVSDRTLHAEPI